MYYWISKVYHAYFIINGLQNKYPRRMNEIIQVHVDIFLIICTKLDHYDEDDSSYPQICLEFPKCLSISQPCLPTYQMY